VVCKWKLALKWSVLGDRLELADLHPAVGVFLVVDGSDRNRAEGVWMRCDVWSRFPGGHGGWWFMAGCVGLGHGLAIAPLALER
jgi:hypothetical protein